jgi:hypothetical protein
MAGPQKEPTMPKITIDEAKLTSEILRIAGGRVLLAVLGAAGIGFAIGALLF